MTQTGKKKLYKVKKHWIAAGVTATSLAMAAMGENVSADTINFDSSKEAVAKHITQIKSENKGIEETHKQAEMQYQNDYAQYQKDKKQYDQDYQEYLVKEDNYKKAWDNYHDQEKQYQKDHQVYEEKQAAYNQKYEAYQNKLKDYQEKQAQYERDLAKYNENEASIAKVKQEQVNNPETISSDMTAVESWTNLKGGTVSWIFGDGNKVNIYAKGQVHNFDDIKNGNYSIIGYAKEKVDDSQIISSIIWDNVAPIGNVIAGDQMSRDYGLGDLYNTSTGQTTQVWTVRHGETVIIPKAVHLQNGEVKDLKVTFYKHNEPSIGKGYICFWNANGAINYYDGNSYVGERPNDKIQAVYSVVDATNGQKPYLWVNSAIDLDGGQYLEIYNDQSETRLLSVGGGIHVWGNKDGAIKVQADGKLGWDFGRNKNENALDGTNSVPDGTVTYAVFSNVLNTALCNTGVDIATMVASSDFGIGLQVKIFTNFTPPVKPEKPIFNETPIQEPNKPKTPTLDKPQKPLAPTPPTLIYLPNKENLNDKLEDINGKVVLDNSVNNYRLTWDFSKFANVHKDITKEEIKTGFFYIDDYPEKAVSPNITECNLTVENEKIANVEIKQFENVLQAPDFIQKQIAENNIAIKGAFLAFIPKDNQSFYDNYVKTGKSITINAPMIVKEGFKGSYGNNAYQFTFGKATPTITVYNQTPNPKPIKKDFSKDGVNIDGRKVLANSTNFYELTWDLTKYQNIYASDQEKAQGFYMIDDYPEEALNFDIKNVQIKDSFGTNVHGIKLAVYKKLTDAPKALQEMLKKHNLTINGAFIVINPKNVNDFYENYVQTGNNLYLQLPMQVKETFVGQYKNQAIQLDFNRAYLTNSVVNNVEKVQPVKKDLNQKGVNIDGKTVLPKTTNVYQLTWDLDQYKNAYVEKGKEETGFYYIDDYPEEALNFDPKKTSFTDSKGNQVHDLNVNIYHDLKETPKQLQQIIAKRNINLHGDFVVISAKNNQDFLNKYFKTGNNIIINLPMTVKEGFAGEYKNKAWQIDMQQVYATNIVVNNVPSLKATKEIDSLTNENKNNQLVQINEVAKYVLHSPVVAVSENGLAEKLFDISGYDALNAEYDQYTNQYKITNTVDIKLINQEELQQMEREKQAKLRLIFDKLQKIADKNGIIKKGTDLSEFVNVSYGAYQLKTDSQFVHEIVDNNNHSYQTGEIIPKGTIIKDVFSWNFNAEFIELLANDSSFAYDVEIQFKRIKAGKDISNEAVFSYNNVQYHTNKVTTFTPKKQKKISNKQLPKTAIQQNNKALLAVFLLLTGMLGLSLWSGKRKNKND